MQKKGGVVQLKTAIGRVMHTTIRAQNLQSSSELSAKQTGLSQWIHLRMMGTRCGASPIRFHDLRHTAASWLRMSGADIHTVAQLLGHKDLRMASRYQHLSPFWLRQWESWMRFLVPFVTQTLPQNSLCSNGT